MNTGVIVERIAAASLAPRARIIGVVYLLYFMTAVLAQFFVSRKLFVYGDAVNLIAYTFYIVLTVIGYLIFRSTFLPRLRGWLIAFAGLGWLAFLSPPIAKYLSLYIEVLGILAEASLMLWLLVMGVNVQRWKEQVSAAGASMRT